MLKTTLVKFSKLLLPKQRFSFLTINRSLCFKNIKSFSDNEPGKSFKRFQRGKKVKPSHQADIEQNKTEENKNIKTAKSDENPIENKNEDEVSKKEENEQKQKSQSFTEEKKPEPEQKTEEEQPIKNEEKKDEKNTEKGQESKGGSEKSHTHRKKDKGGKIEPPFEIKPIHYLGAIAIIYIFWKPLFDSYFDKYDIPYTEFQKHLEKDEIKSIKFICFLEDEVVRIKGLVTTSNGQERYLKILNIDNFMENLEKFQLEVLKKPQENLIPFSFDYSFDKIKLFEDLARAAMSMATLGLFLYIFLGVRKTFGSMGKGNDIFGIGKSNLKVFASDSKIKTRFNDVAGLDEAKLEIVEFVDFLKKPEKYLALGAHIPRGALLSGPPGTGKTMLAKACAGEAGVPFFYMSGSDFVEMFVGLGASRIRDLFKHAKEKSPSIIFIDEIDAVGRKRESRVGGNDERENTLNQLLVEMDGFGTDNKVVVLAATNRKELLDSALTRPGRFDRTIEITLPDIEGRCQIFMVHLSPLKLNPEKTKEEYAKRLATLTPGFSGADISNLCNEAAILAARKEKTEVDSMDFELATERVIAGLEKNRMISEEERKVVAYHEAGHAVVSWFLEGGAPLLKLTIIPRSKGSLGYAQYLPNESSMQTKQELIDQICCILGGRCSEQFFFQKITSGAADDLQKVSKLAQSLITKFGMSEKLGYMGFLEGDFQNKYSDKSQQIIDEEVTKLVKICLEKTLEIVEIHKNHIENLAKALLEKETLDLARILEILGERPFPPKSNFKAYLETKKKQDKEKIKENNPDENIEKKKDEEISVSNKALFKNFEMKLK